MRDTFVKTLLEIAKSDPNVHIITGDLGFGVLKPFFEQLPNQITNVGIAEQNMTGFATGLALEGKIVFTYSIGNFPTLRTLEQIRNDAAYHNANVKIVCVGGGFVYGSLGMSHHATEDIAIMRALPNIKVYAPGDLVEAEIITKQIVYEDGVGYLRLGRGGEKQIHLSNEKIDINSPIQIVKGTNVALISTGAILEEVYAAISELADIGMHPSLFSMPKIKPIDTKSILKIINEYKYIITIEEHTIIGGLGSVISDIITQTDNANSTTLIKMGINDKYTSEVGDQKYLRELNQISSADIYKKVLSLNGK